MILGTVGVRCTTCGIMCALLGFAMFSWIGATMHIANASLQVRAVHQHIRATGT